MPAASASHSVVKFPLAVAAKQVSVKAESAWAGESSVEKVGSVH